MTHFDPPGFVADLTDAQLTTWSNQVSAWLDRARAGNPALNDGPRNQFFNALTNPPAADKAVRVIAWNAFPRQVRSASISDLQRWQRADASRDVQDEYCEWSVQRDPVTQKIVRVTFTCEAPEYWTFLAGVNPQKVLDLYRQFVSPAVQMADLFPGGGAYNPRNRFNNSTTNGAMHLIQGANTLRAEIELGAAATIRRIRNGQELTDAQALIRCSQYGAPGRNSDPFIGEQVNALARQRADLTINNPIGLYLHEFNPVGWTTPNNEDPKTFWTFVRGKDKHFVRAVYEVPANRGYVVGDIKIAGKPIRFGGQIADFITIKLEGLATRIGQSTVQPFQGCIGGGPAAPPSAIGEAIEPLPSRTLLALYETDVPEPSLAEAAGLPPDDVLPPALAQLAALPPAPKLPYPKLPDALFATRKVSGRIIAYATPDSTYAVTRKLLDSAQHSIVIGIYDFTASYVKDHLKRALRRGVSVSLLLETNSDDEHALFTELQTLGATCVKAAATKSGNPIVYFDNAHEKIIVVDNEVVMIQSGNWSENSIPFNRGNGVVIGQFMEGNRDMGLAVESRELAMFFADLVSRDMRMAQGLPDDAIGAVPPAAPPGPSIAAALFFEAAPTTIPPLYRSQTVVPQTPVSIKPAVTPENFESVLKPLLRSAKKSIRIEQQYIRGNQAVVRELLDQIKAARTDHPNLDIRIIVSPKYLTGNDRTNFFEAMDMYEFAFGDHFRFLSSRHFVHCHNKLIVVDEERVLLGSQNWSTTGIQSNREASLLVDHAGIAAYFSKLFDSDWALSEPTAAPPSLLPDVLDSPRSRTQSTIGDYADV